MNYYDAINWLKTAQDMTPDGGVSAFFNFSQKIWMQSYPEVSGYIIPTFIDAGEEERALRISRWLRKKQLGNGAMPMGYWNSNIPVVFDTGMVLRGWLEAQKVEYDARTQESIDKAVEWLERTWDADPKNFLPTHNVRVVWPLKDYGSTRVDSMLDFFLEMIDDNGWPRIAENVQPEAPLSHFIVYIARGFFECGLVEVGRRIMRSLPSVPSSRYTSHWEPTDDTICIPGVAQASILFDKLGMKAEAQRGRNYLKTLSAPWSTDPVETDYLPNCQLSWSAKFIADALIGDPE